MSVAVLAAPIQLMILMGLSGGLGLPLGIPPGPEEPVLANVAPEECLFYTTWSGMAKPDPSAENQTEQLLAEPEVQFMFAEIERRINAALRQTVAEEDPDAVPIAEDAARWAKTLITHPTAVFLSGVTIGLTGLEVRGGALVCVDDDGPKLKETLEKYQQMFLQGAAQPVQIGGATWYRLKLDPQAPAITWGVRGRYLIVGVGEGSVEGILSRAATAPPTWLTDLRKQLPVGRTSTVTYVNLAKILQLAVPLAGREAPRIQAFLSAAGLDRVTSLASVTGLDETGFVGKTLLGLSGEPAGLLSFAAAGPLTAEDLASIPADATIALAARIDAESIFDTILSIVEKIEPSAREEANEGIAEIQRMLGFDLRDDVLKSLGDSVCVYNSPEEGGLVFTGLTVVVPVKDHAKLSGAHLKLLAFARAQMAMGAGRRGPRIEQLKFAGQEVYFFNARDDEFPLAPAWCLTDKELIVAPFPQNIKAYLTRGDEFKSLATVPEVAGVLQDGDGPVVLSYYDTGKIFELAYPFVPMFAQVVLSELAREGIDVNLSLLPSAGSIGKHRRPGVAAVRRSPAGIEMIGRQTIPGVGVAALAPMAAFVALPVVRTDDRGPLRMRSMNNLVHIGLTMQAHHEAFGTFPAAYSTNADGEPLLSWRVHVLPYLEEQALYEQFKLDEPWDSEHNRKLVAAMPQIYRAPGSHAEPGKTTYLTVRGKDTAFPGKEKLRFVKDFPDGLSKTVAAVQSSDEKAVIWTRPDDYEYDEQDPTAGLIDPRTGGFNVVMCDGSVHFVDEFADPELLKLLFTRNDGKAFDLNDLLDPPPRDTPSVRRSRIPSAEPGTVEELEELERLEEGGERIEIVPRR